MFIGDFKKVTTALAKYFPSAPTKEFKYTFYTQESALYAVVHNFYYLYCKRLGSVPFSDPNFYVTLEKSLINVVNKALDNSSYVAIEPCKENKDNVVLSYSHLGDYTSSCRVLLTAYAPANNTYTAYLKLLKPLDCRLAFISDELDIEIKRKEVNDYTTIPFESYSVKLRKGVAKQISTLPLPIPVYVSKENLAILKSGRIGSSNNKMLVVFGDNNFDHVMTVGEFEVEYV